MECQIEQDCKEEATDNCFICRKPMCNEHTAQGMHFEPMGSESGTIKNHICKNCAKPIADNMAKGLG